MLQMRRLNTKERQRTINSHFLMAFYYAILFYHERHRHTFFSFYCLGVTVLILILILWIVFVTPRVWQKLAGSLLLIAYVAGFLPLEKAFPTIDPHITRTLAIGFWWTAVALASLDWILEHFIESAPVTTPGLLIDIPKISGPHLPADDAHDFVLTRLRAEADAEKSPLSALQLQFLDYSRIASEEDAKAVEEEFYKQENYWEFKKQIIHLLTLAIQKDRKENPDNWRK